MAEEFEESEVVFQENEGSEENEECNFPGQHLKSGSSKLKRRKKIKSLSSSSSSVPVNIPVNISSWNIQSTVDSVYLVDDEDYDGEMVPPHVITGRRIAGKVMAFSVCTGNGRTLKGRDLSEVRNSILRLTGFLET